MGWVSRLLIGIPLFFFLLVCHLHLREYIEDDAYIHIRVARNLLELGVPYFDTKSPVAASTSTLWTWVLAVMMFFCGTEIRIVQIAIAVLNSGLIFVAYLLMAGSIQRLTPTNPYLAHLCGACSILLSAFPATLGGMESSLLVGLLSLGIYCFVLGAYPALWACGVFAVATRPESIVPFGLLMLVSLKDITYAKLKVCIALTFIFASFFLLYQFQFFGTVIPHTLGVKEVIYELGYQDTIRLMLTQYLYSFPSLFFRPQMFSIAILVFLLMSVVTPIVASIVKSGRARGIKRREVVSNILLLSSVVIVVAYLSKRVLIFPWYVPNYMFPLVAGLLVSICGPVHLLRKILVALVISPLAYSFWINGALVLADRSAYFSFLSGARAKQYQLVGTRLFKLYPTATLLTPEIGGLGEGFRGQVKDACGLAFKDALPFHPMAIPSQRSSGLECGVPAGLVTEVQPDIVVAPKYLLKDFVASPEIENFVGFSLPVFPSDDKELVGDETLWGESQLNVYLRKSTIPLPRL